MDRRDFARARDMFTKTLELQPNLFHPMHTGEQAGAEIAQTAWGFIREFNAQYQKEVQGAGQEE